jgi:hypothetical protein
LSLSTANHLAYMAGVATLNSGVRGYFVSNKNYFQVPVTRMDKDNSPDADGDFSNAPNFNWNDDKVKFSFNWTNNANDNFGTVSGFVSKSFFTSTGT